MLTRMTVESWPGRAASARWPCRAAGRTMSISSEAAGVVDPARASASISVMSPVSVIGARRAHFAHDEDALALVRLDRDRDLRVA